MDNQIEIEVNKKIQEIMKEFNMKEDMLGYKNLYNDLRRKILFEEYNILIEDVDDNFED